MVFSEGVKCPSFHAQFSDPFVCTNTAFLPPSQCEHTSRTPSSLKALQKVFAPEVYDLGHADRFKHRRVRETAPLLVSDN